MAKLQGLISPDGKVTFGERPKPRLDIVIALPSKPMAGLSEVITDFIRETLPKEYVVSTCSSLPNDPFKVGILADRTDPPSGCKQAGNIGYVREDGSCILLCGIMTEHAGGDSKLLRKRLERGYAACLDLLGKGLT